MRNKQINICMQARRKRYGMAAVAAPKICREREREKDEKEKKRKREEKRKRKREGEQEGLCCGCKQLIRTVTKL